MQDRTQTNPPSAVNASSRDRNDQPYLGGADAVDKTTYAGDARGADTAEAATASARLTATVPHAGGIGLLGGLVFGLAAIVLVAYAVGLFG